MADETTDARRNFGDLAPQLAEITDKVLFGEVWANPALSPRDRSLVTITSLISLYRINELPFHLNLALKNGVTHDEIIATISHLAFYACWPPAITALQLARKTFADAEMICVDRESVPSRSAVPVQILNFCTALTDR